ncbi:MAG: iron-sulfur cluster repair di-iron protein [Bacteroidetes bacterium CG2_30_33_31]|nr:MAG: iron-sulfur cluster repair di-iron protein [Bacteroidetes bacterium CG2_30_33_31]
MNSIETIDVTVIEPKLKHPTIFTKFDNLKQGEAFIIYNDHDPKPLYYQILGERGEIFTWEYLQQGPEIWKVKIFKKINLISELSIGEIVAKDIRKIDVFRKYGIDFCCGGEKTLTKVCEENGLSQTQLEIELSKVENTIVSANIDYNNWEIDFLADYIINIHHKYVKANLDLINELALKVANVHGDLHPEIIKISEIFSNVNNVFTKHLYNEEKSVFPYIKKLVAIKNGNQEIAKIKTSEIASPIESLKKEHDEAGDDFKEMRRISKNFLLPTDACNSYTYLYKKLEEFEEKLHEHVHLENNILFPKAIHLENELISKQL